MQLRPPAVDLVFRPGVRYRWSSGSEAVVEVLDAGTLHLPTGRLVVVDPFLGPALERFAVPFTVTAPPGRYAVSLSVARWDRPSDPNTPAPVRAVAAAKLTIRDEPVVAWELGLQPGQDPATLQPDELFGFVVDSGSGAFLDASAVAALHALGDLGPDQDLHQDPELFKLLPELRSKRVVNLVVEPASGLNVVVFRCGMGDGLYPPGWAAQLRGSLPALSPTSSCSRTVSDRSPADRLPTDWWAVLAPEPCSTCPGTAPVPVPGRVTDGKW